MLQRPRLWLFVIVAVAIFAAGAFLLTGGDSAAPLSTGSEPSPLDIENENAVVDPSAKGPFPLTPGLYVFDTETGEVRRVLDQKGDNFGFDTATTYQWSQDGEWLVSTSVGNVNKIIAVSRDGSRRREAAGQSWTVQRQDDGAFVLHMRPVSETDEEQPEILGRLDLDTMAVSELVKSNGGAVSPDGRYVAQVTNDGALVLTDVTTGETRTLYSIPRNEGWISLPAGPVWSPDGKSLLLQESRRDRPALLALDAEGTNEPARLEASVIEAEWSPDGKQVAYVAYAEGSPAFPYPGEIYVWEPENNSGPRRIVDGSSPAWSPTGGSLAFTRSGALWRIDIASGTQQPLLRAAMPILDEPRWSPDGRYIAFRAQNVGGEIRAIDADGTNERYLGLGASPSYSPDGTHIAFMAGSGGLGFAGNLMDMRADGTEIVALAPVFYGDTIPACPGRQYAWSPDSEQIAFADLKAEVMIVGAGGGDDPRTLSPGDGPSFFPDSGSVVYARSDRGGPPGCTVYSRSTAAPVETALAEGVRNPLVSADGRYLVGESDSFYRVQAVSVIELARPENRVDVPQAWFPSLSADGSRFAYFTAAETKGSVFPPYGSPGRIVVAALNAPATTLAEVTVPVAVRDIAWSPDGSELAYSVSTQDGTSIYVVDIANPGAPRRLTEGYSPSWSPDGQTILFARYEN